MLVTVTEVEQNPGSTVLIGFAENEAGEQIRFAGDHRAMSNLAEVISVEGPVDVDLDAYQILSVQGTLF